MDSSEEAYAKWINPSRAEAQLGVWEAWQAAVAWKQEQDLAAVADMRRLHTVQILVGGTTSVNAVCDDIVNRIDASSRRSLESDPED